MDEIKFFKCVESAFSLQLDRSTREIELGLDYGTPTMTLAGQSLKFENGQWITGEEDD